MKVNDRPKVGVAVFVVKNGRFVMGHRKGSHGHGTWGLAGGKLDFGESWEACAARETMEEFGLSIKDVRFLAITNDIFESDNEHYVTIFMAARWAGGEAKIMEPEKCDEIGWFTYETMPDTVFLPLINLKKQYPRLPL